MVNATMPLPAEIVQRLCEIVYLSCIPLCTLRMLDFEGIPSAAYDGQTCLNSVDEVRRDLYSLCLVNRAFCWYAQPLLFRRVQMNLPYRFMLLLDVAEQERRSGDALSAIRMLDFATFRAMGLRRTVGESQERRFVTPERLLKLIDATTGMVAFGSSATMDSALSLDVLESLVLRGGASSQPSRMRDVSVDRSISSETHNALQSLDFCGCVSPRFVEAMTAFVDKHLPNFQRASRSIYDLEEEEEDLASSANASDEESERGRGRQTIRERSRSFSRRRAPVISAQSYGRKFPSLQRLGLAGVTLSRDVLSSFVLAFPNLTHLDLSQTKADAGLLEALSHSHIRLESLSLSKCRALTSQSIVDLMFSPVTSNLTELALQGTLLFPTPISPDDLRTILQRAPCMHKGAMRYLDLGGCPMTDDELQLFHGQPALLDLGLSSVPGITLHGVANLLLHRTPNVQILSLSHSCAAHCTAGHIHAVNLYHDLIAPCTQRPQALAIAQQLRRLGLRQDDVSSEQDEWHAPTNLRVIELSSGALSTVQGGISTWKSIWGSGRRGWVVDTAAGPTPEATDIDIPIEFEDRGRSADLSSLHRLKRLSSASPNSRRSLLSDERTLSSTARPEEARGRSQPGWIKRSHSRSRAGALPLHRQETSIERPTANAVTNASRSRSLSLSAPRETSAVGVDNVSVCSQVVRDLPPDHPRRLELDRLSVCNGSVPGTIGWHSHKMEVLLGYGMLGHEIGNYAWLAYQTN